MEQNTVTETTSAHDTSPAGDPLLTEELLTEELLTEELLTEELLVEEISIDGMCGVY